MHLFMRNVLKHTYQCLLNDDSHQQIISLPDSFKSNMFWRLNNIDFGYNPLKSYNYELEIFSDASKTDWGEYCNGISTGGYWDNIDKKLHINILQLKAAFFYTIIIF